MIRVSFHHALALLHLLLCAASASAADDLMTTSFAANSIYRLETPKLQPTPVLQSTTTTAFAPRVNPLENQVSEFIAVTSNRLFAPQSPADQRLEFAALIHPLGNPLQQASPALRTATDFGALRASGIVSDRSAAGLGPVHAGSTQSLSGLTDSTAASVLSFQAR